MTVRCPHCSTGYQLPDHLLGPRGARVRCPQCGKSFEVPRTEASPRGSSEELPEADLPLTPAESEEALGLPPLSEDPGDVATRVLDALAARLGEQLEASHAAGRLWADHGEDLMRAWDEYRAELGPKADTAVFRERLRTRWNVDLGLATPPDSARESNS